MTEVIEGSCHCEAVHWQFQGTPESATACNCTVYRRYGVLWAYDYENEGITVSGQTQTYIRGESVEFHFARPVAVSPSGDPGWLTNRGGDASQ